MAISRTAQAVRRVRSGETVRSVARDIGISEAAVYAQIKREEGLKRCPCCGQVLKEGFKVRKDVLRSVPQTSKKKSVT